MEDSAAVIGLLIALAATAAGQWWQRPEFDGIGSLAIGGLLAVTALLLARETKGLLIGEPADAHVVELILETARREPGVVSANGVLTTHVAPDQIIASVSLEFDDGLRAPEIEAAVTSIEDAVRARAPAIVLLFVKPQTAGGYDRARRRYFGVAAES